MGRSFIPLLTLVALSLACATTLSTKEGNGIKPRYFEANYGLVFFKTIEAVNNLDWTIRSQDYATGKIVGETIYGGGGKPRFITIDLTESPGTVQVDISLSSVNPDLKFYFSRQIKKLYSELDKLIQAGEM
jgi:hypothetical protein